MQQVSLSDYCQEARSFIQSGEPGKAILVARHILRHYPRHVDSYRLLAQALLASGDPMGAATQFRRVLSADPEDITSRLGLSQIYRDAGDLDRAIGHMKRAVDLSPGDPDLRSQLGQLVDTHQGNGRPETLGITRAALGRIHANAGLHAKAAQEFRAVLEQNPERSDVQTALAEVLWRSGNQVEAAETCRQILEKLPNALKPNLMIGALWLNRQEPHEAEPYLRIAQGLDPENLVAQTVLGEAPLLALRQVNIEPLGDEEFKSVQHSPLPAPPAEPASVSEVEKPAVAWMSEPHSEPHKEETTPMSDEERADEEFELPDWLEGVGDDLLGESDEQPAASSPAEPGSEAGEDMPAWLLDLVSRAEKAGPSQEPGPAEPGDVPDWLRDLRPEVSQATPAESELPDWLASAAAGQPPEDLQAEQPVPGPIEPESPEVSPAVPELPGPPISREDDEVSLALEGLFSDEGLAGQVAEEEALPDEEWLHVTADLEQTPFEPEQPEPVAWEPPIQEPEAPTVPVAQDVVDQAGLPDWLREIQAGGAQPEPEAEPAMEEPEPLALESVSDVAEESELPAWLREISAAEPALPDEAEPIMEAPPTLPQSEVDEEGLPDWLQAYAQPADEQVVDTEPLSPPTEEPVATADEGRALWEQILAEEGVDLSSAEEAPPPEAAGMTAEEWLRSTADLEQTPAARREPEPLVEEPLAEEVEAPLPEADLPDWLSQIAAGEAIAAEEDEGIILPAGAGPIEELPDWMRELQDLAARIEPSEEAEAGVEAREPGEVEVDKAGLPDWLREPEAGMAEFLKPEAATPAETPEWLTELESEEMLLAESDFEEAVELETGEMPEWLGEVMAEEPPLAEEWPPEPVEAGAQEEQLPDWLREFREQRREAAVEPTSELEELEAPAEISVGEEFAEPAELPDWLVHLREGVEAPPPAEEPTVAEIEPALPVEEPEVIETGVPEWEVPALEEALEVPQAEMPPAVPGEPEPEAVEAPEPVEVSEPEPVVTRKLEVIDLEALPKDADARLSMARTALNSGDWSDALAIYETLVNSSELLDRVIDNLEVGVRRYPDDPTGYQLLGDARMKDGRLRDALEAYRTALSKL